MNLKIGKYIYIPPGVESYLFYLFFFFCYIIYYDRTLDQMQSSNFMKLKITLAFLNL
jgi:hypothetical protein